MSGNDGGCGWMDARTGVGYGVTHLPYRERPCLCRIEGNTWTPVAWFREDYRAEEFVEALRELLTLRR